jgi:osmoprotectant transport system ATP-binding protein
VIALKGLTKHFPGHARPAVDSLSLEIAEGETCVLIGPSGCGKTTTMRMVNRMIEPDAGTVELAGRDVTHAEPIELRRSMGYVIQQIGLFPHMTIAENIATVPRLLRWDAARIAARVDELLDLVAMDAEVYRDRFPRELSGGQRQRVGVARALAADPPVMLMDEPFGAIDPITRGRLQQEFLRIQQRLRKTILFVTHDIDEAIRMGDRIAILRAGRIVQHDTPEAILARPADAFVEEFVGTDRVLKRLSLLSVGAHADADCESGTDAGLDAGASLRDALTLLLVSTAEALAVTDEAGRRVGTLSLERIRETIRAHAAEPGTLAADGSCR